MERGPLYHVLGYLFDEVTLAQTDVRRLFKSLEIKLGSGIIRMSVPSVTKIRH